MRIRSFRRLAAAAVVAGTSAFAYKSGGWAYGYASPLALDGDVPPRSDQLIALKGSSKTNPFDILIIGGGATGAGAALDAQTRGLRTALVEREDFAAGSSSRSTKLIHGGVRYLEKAVFNFDIAQLKLVFEALKERATLLHIAPHLTNVLPTMTPCYSYWEIPYYYAGLKLYDIVAGSRLLHLSRFYSSKEAHASFPTLAKTSPDQRTLKGAVVYYDGQMNDARLNVAIACSAALAGATVMNHTEVVALLQTDEGEVCGARVRDRVGGGEFDVHSRVVVNAAGPFVDSVRKLADHEAKPIINASCGVHIVLPEIFSPDSMGLIIPKTKDNRVVFMLPWLGKTVAGTTDHPTAVTSRPEPEEDDIAYLLETVNDYLQVKVRRQDILSTWSGIRPLPANPNPQETSNVVREHVISFDKDGLISIAGGKWTTYRAMAADVIDAAIKTGGLQPTKSRSAVTEDVLLVGASGYEPALFAVLTQQYVRMKRTHGGKVVPAPMDTAAARHLARAYGTRADRVALIAQVEALGKRLAHGYPDLEAEVVYCARYEYCESVIDFLARRSRLAFLDTAAATRAVPRVIELLGQELKWDKKRRKEELADAHAFLETFRAKHNAQFSDGKH